MNFVVSYSCGKDSSMALWKMLQKGHKLVGLVVSFSKNNNRSFFHGVSRHFLEEYAKTLGTKLFVAEIGSGEDYDAVYEKALHEAKKNGADTVVFGDIDIVGHREWDMERAENVGLKAEFPLWHINRRENVEECLQCGIKAVITCVDTEKLSRDYLGKILNKEMLQDFENVGIDVCGENGEYHTMVIDAPMFKFPLQYKLGRIRENSQWPVIEVLECEA